MPFCLFCLFFKWFFAQKLHALPYLFCPVTIPEKAIMTNPHKPIREHVKQEPPDELGIGKSHGFSFVSIGIILVGKGYGIIFL